MSSVLVTGASGFIGWRIADYLQTRGHRVSGMVRPSHLPMRAPFHLVPGDLLDKGAMATATQGVDTVIHCAGLAHRPSASWEEYYRVNVAGTESLLEQAIRNGVRQFVFISSISVYGPSRDPHLETDIPKPTSYYGTAKLQAEDACHEITSKEGMPLLVLRLSAVYGENEPGNINRLIRAVDRFGPIVVGDGQNKKSLTYVGNVAMLCSHILEHHTKTTLTCNVSDPQPYTLLEIIKVIERGLGRNRRIRFLNRGMGLAGSRLLCSAMRVVGRASPVTPHQIETLTETSVCDVGRLRSALSFEPPTLLEEGMRITTSSYRSIIESNSRPETHHL